MLSYFDVGGRKRVFILSLVIFSLPYLMIWGVERLFSTGSSIIKRYLWGSPSNPWRYKNRTLFGEFLSNICLSIEKISHTKKSLNGILPTTFLRFHYVFLGFIGNKPYGKHIWEWTVLHYPINMVIYHYPLIGVIYMVILHILLSKIIQICSQIITLNTQFG